MIRIKVTRQLRDFTLQAEICAATGETLVLMGSNGSGKTTVLNLIAGLMTPDSGLIEACGKTLFSAEAGIDLPPERRDIGYMFQSYALFPHMSVFDNVAFGLRMRKIPKDELHRQVRAELEAAGLWELRDAKASRLSGGQKQKVALARSLITRPGVLLLDEPLSALDTKTHEALRGTLRSRLRREGITSVIVLHSVEDALALGDRACVLDRGQVICSGTPAEVLRQRQSGIEDSPFD